MRKNVRDFIFGGAGTGLGEEEAPWLLKPYFKSDNLRIKPPPPLYYRTLPAYSTDTEDIEDIIRLFLRDRGYTIYYRMYLSDWIGETLSTKTNSYLDHKFLDFFPCVPREHMRYF